MVLFTTLKFADLGFVKLVIGINHIPAHLNALSSVTTIRKSADLPTKPLSRLVSLFLRPLL